MFSVLVIRLRSLILLRVSSIVMPLRMFLLLITFLKASHSFRNRLLVICKNAYLFATMIMTRRRFQIGRAVQQECRDRYLHSFPTRRSSDLAYHLLEGFPFIQEPPSGDLQERVLIRHHDYDQKAVPDRKSGSAGMPRPISTLFPYTTLFRSCLSPS